MALKDLVVHIDHGRCCEARIAAALALAARHDAHLTGVYVKTEARIPGYIRAELGDDLLARQAALAATALADAERRFNEAARRQNVAAEWRCVEGAPVAALGLHARYADVLIAGQHDPSGDDGSDEPGMPERLILAAGRPVLVVPYAGTFPTIGERVMVAWDASRLASRAIHDALPLLQTAKKVVVLAVNPRPGDDGHGDIPSAVPAPRPPRHHRRGPARLRRRSGRRRDAVVARRRRGHRSPGRRRLRPPPLAGDRLGRRHPLSSRPHDGAGVDVALKGGPGVRPSPGSPSSSCTCD